MTQKQQYQKNQSESHTNAAVADHIAAHISKIANSQRGRDNLRLLVRKIRQGAR